MMESTMPGHDAVWYLTITVNAFNTCAVMASTTAGPRQQQTHHACSFACDHEVTLQQLFAIASACPPLKCMENRISDNDNDTKVGSCIKVDRSGGIKAGPEERLHTLPGAVSKEANQALCEGVML
jgi:hypothetical protein